MGEELLVSSVHLGKVVHGGDEDVDLNDALEGGTGGLEDGGQVLATLLGELADVVLLEGENLAGWEGWDLAGADRKSTRLNSSHSGESRMPSSA